MEPLIANKFRIDRQIGNLNYAKIYIGTDVETNEEVAIKRENVNKHRLLREYKMYERLQGKDGIPNIRAFRTMGHHNFLVTSLLGPSLGELFNQCNKKFSLKTVLMLADQMIDRVQLIHSYSCLHRNINPNNFLMGLGKDENQVYASGLGQCILFRVFPGAHFPFREKRRFVGTIRYGSMNTLSGIQYSKREDLESLGFVLMYFLRGSLPWQGIKGLKKSEKLDKICEMKGSIEALCEGYPPEFASYFHYCRSLQSHQKPDYLHLKKLFNA